MFGRQPIARQIIALVTAAVLATAGAMAAITFIGPPPRPAPTQMSDIVQALRGGAAGRLGTRPMRRSAATAEPAPRAGEMRDRALERWLAGQLASDPSALRAFTTEPPAPGPSRPPDGGLRGEGSFGWRYDGRWQVVRIDRGVDVLYWWATVASAMIVLLGTIIALAWRSARAITLPLDRLAAHARGDSSELHLCDGEAPPEVEVVAAALAGFQRSQLQQVTQRTRMLSAIAHDLGTPLARLAFRLEALPDAQREAAFGEIAAMRRLIDDSLALDRSGSEPAARFDLAELVAAMVAECQVLNLRVTEERIESATVLASNLALRRLLQNLIDNALRYGSAARIGLTCGDGQARLVVRDLGPGFSADMLAHGCEPFSRGEMSRNPGSGGHGLGLAIAAAIAAQYRGSLTLRNGADGGEVIVAIPALPQNGFRSLAPTSSASPAAKSLEF
ncbi:MAG: HAMP domain-containing histidine kinase [Sphingomonadales bacterium]|nr:HAMP domain-containing histidine kinase [Sphingomonadales bacterium]